MVAVLFGTLFIFFIYTWFIEPAWLAISEHIVTVDQSKLAKPVRIVLITDIHVGFWSVSATTRKNIRTLFRYHQLHPTDIMLFGGDFIDRNRKYLPELTEILKHFEDFKIPMFAVLGNHDYTTYADPAKIIQALHNAHVTVLRNQSVVVGVRGEQIGLIGLDDLQQSREYQPVAHNLAPASYPERAKKVQWAVEADHLPNTIPRVLITHNPDGAYVPTTIEPDVVVAGHTHGGQWILLDWLGKYIYRIMPPGSFIGWAGRRMIGGVTVLVSRGFEGSLFPTRFLRRPEVIIVTLTPNK